MAHATGGEERQETWEVTGWVDDHTQRCAPQHQPGSIFKEDRQCQGSQVALQGHQVTQESLDLLIGLVTSVLSLYLISKL